MQKKYIYLLTFAYAFSTFAQGILMPIYAFFVQKIGGGILETSWAIGLYAIIRGLGTIAIHKTAMSHKYPRHFLWIGWFLWLMSLAVYFIMQNIITLYISQIISGLGEALEEPIFDAEFSKIVAKDPAVGWSIFEGTISIFSGIAAFVGGFIATWYGFDVLLFCMIGIATISFLLIAYYTSTAPHID